VGTVGWAGVGLWISEVFSNLNDSMIPADLETFTPDDLNGPSCHSLSCTGPMVLGSLPLMHTSSALKFGPQTFSRLGNNRLLSSHCILEKRNFPQRVIL